MRKSALLLLSLAFGAPAPDAALTGVWYGPPPANSNRDLRLVLDVRGNNVTGEVESPTRIAKLAEGRVRGDGFTAIAASVWDGRPARRPVEARLRGGELHLRIQAWPEGPMQSYVMRKVSDSPAIERPRPLPLPPLRDLPGNGLARTPPMGWSSWNKFGCNVSDSLIREMAAAMAATGMRDAGYVYVNIDDCWQQGRDAEGNLRPDPKRFPDMKALARYVHGMGLKLGIYSSPGPRTCAGYEGSYGHEERDARAFADWGVDYLKYDWCSAGKLYPEADMRAAYQKMGAALQAAGRPIVYSLCQYGLARVWEWGRKAGGNLWRTTGDIGDNWPAVEQIGFVQQLGLARFAGPGGWNDPDMLEVGNGGMSLEEYRTHMGLWALLAAPLIAGNDLRAMTPEIRALLLNREVIAVNQDPLGRQAERAWKSGPVEAWVRPLSGGSRAIGLFNRGRRTERVSPPWRELGLASPPAKLRDLWRREDTGARRFTLPRHGSVLLRVLQE